MESIVEFNNNQSPELVAQLILSASLDENNKNLIPKEFYLTLIAAATIIKALQNLPGDKESFKNLPSSPYSLGGIFCLIEDNGTLINSITIDLANIIKNCTQNGELNYFTDEKASEYINSKLLDAVDYLDITIINNESLHTQILEALNFVKIKEDKIIKTFKMF